MSAFDARAWFTFRLPAAVAHVPAETEADARSVLSRVCYRGAPVDAWPCVGSRWGSRESLAPAATGAKEGET